MVRLKTVLLLLLFGLTTQTLHGQESVWQKGAAIEPKSAEDFGSETFAASLKNLAETHANYVALVIPIYQSTSNSVDLGPGPTTPSGAALITAINQAHALELKVMLKMHPEIKTGEWRGFINPADRQSWFNNYTQILVYYSQIAQAHQVEELCLGTELYKMTTPKFDSRNTPYWQWLISQVRANYSGLLTYSAQHTYPAEAEEIEFWDSLDFIGYSAYFPLGHQLKTSWAYWEKTRIIPIFQKWKKPVLFTEVGYRSLVDSHQDPWHYARSGPVDEAEQAKNYEALLSYWKNHQIVRGILLWRWDSHPAAGGKANTDYTPQNKQAQEVMTKWFYEEKPAPEPTPQPSPKSVSLFKKIDNFLKKRRKRSFEQLRSLVTLILNQ